MTEGVIVWWAARPFPLKATLHDVKLQQILEWAPRAEGEVETPIYEKVAAVPSLILNRPSRPGPPVFISRF